MDGSSASFVSQLRARPGTIVIDGPDPITVRVQVPEVWDVVRVQLPRTEPVLALKVRALDALYPDAGFHEDFVLKLGGWEVLDENATVAETGAVDGSIFLLTNRRRRPVR
jgi:hypothetical protein